MGPPRDAAEHHAARRRGKRGAQRWRRNLPLHRGAHHDRLRACTIARKWHTGSEGLRLWPRLGPGRSVRVRVPLSRRRAPVCSTWCCCLGQEHNVHAPALLTSCSDSVSVGACPQRPLQGYSQDGTCAGRGSRAVSCRMVHDGCIRVACNGRRGDNSAGARFPSRFKSVLVPLRKYVWRGALWCARGFLDASDVPNPRMALP